MPIINGKYQCFGGNYKYRAENMKLSGDELSLDIEKAYEEGLVDKIHRTFKIGEKSIILRMNLYIQTKQKVLWRDW